MLSTEVVENSLLQSSGSFVKSLESSLAKRNLISEVVADLYYFTKAK